jgi:uncharacterized protein with gpF-like domain
MEKTWFAVRDQRTRHDHMIVDGTRLPINEPFSLSNRRAGIVQMMQPGVREQPNGLAVPADEVVNCRCVVAFRAKRGPDGRLLSLP